MPYQSYPRDRMSHPQIKYQFLFNFIHQTKGNLLDVKDNQLLKLKLQWCGLEEVQDMNMITFNVINQITCAK